VARTATGEQISESIEDATKIRELNYEKLVESKRTFMEKRIGEDGRKDNLEDEDEGDDLEEWERHEALHDDVTKQDRTSPYFFEHEIELKWEKGGSGLVFYTDDVFWKVQCYFYFIIIWGFILYLGKAWLYIIVSQLGSNTKK